MDFIEKQMVLLGIKTKTPCWKPDEYCAQVAWMCDEFLRDKTFFVDPSLARLLAKNYPFAVHYMDTLYEEKKCSDFDYHFIYGVLNGWENNQRVAIAKEYFKKEIISLWGWG